MENSLKNAITAEIECRAQRYKTIPADILGEPAWDILLDLALSRLNRQRIQITAVGLNAGLAPTTALRWVTRLEDRGLIRRIPDDRDGRRAWLEILPDAMAKVAACFGFHWTNDDEITSAKAALDEVLHTPNAGSPNNLSRDLEERVFTSKDIGQPKTRSLLLKRATDWVNQDYDERLSFAVQALYVHGYLSAHEYRRIEKHIREDTDLARADRAKSRKERYFQR